VADQILSASQEQRMHTSFPTVRDDGQLEVLYESTGNQPTSDASDMIGTVCLERILNGDLLPIVGGVVTDRADVYTEGNHHVNLGLVDGLEDEM